MNIYPAIDLRNGKSVRLNQGKADQEKIYFDDPAEPAENWKKSGAKWIHCIDLDGAFTGEPKNWDAINKIVSRGLKIQLGGGFRTLENVERAIDTGVSRVVIGTKATNDEIFTNTLLEKFGNKIAVGIDAKNGKVAVKGWVKTIDLNAVDLAKKMEKNGVQTIIYTDISRDGMLSGPNFEALEIMLNSIKINVITSGGVSNIKDIEQLSKISEKHENFDGVIIGKALYENKIDLKNLITHYQ